jgi:pseudaminic acid biosynthesis-associated methylase
MGTMTVKTEQMSVWTGEFGAEYTRRNALTPEEVDELYRLRFGITRTALNERFIGHLPRDVRILEVGTNIGNQLQLLSRQGFSELYGIELQWGALDIARRNLPRANLVQGTALDIPFRDGFFDVVYTAGVLIHIGPTDLATAQREIVRCSSRYVWGDEYYAPAFQEIDYRGHANLLWKGDYSRLYLERFPELTLVREERLPYKDEPLSDTMFLLEKKNSPRS